MEVVLGFDTSCYTTSVAAVDRDGQVLASQRMLLPVESGKCGLRQSEAVFVHVRQVPLVMKELQQRLGDPSLRIMAVAASRAPKEDADSYMPVFLVGFGHAQSLASALGVPCFPFSHQQGHIAAGQLGNSSPGKRFVALHLSGGTTELLLSVEDKLTLLGGSMDLHSGQLVDRVGVALGLAFPAGSQLEKLAASCNEPPRSLLPVSFQKGDLTCHLSGAEAQCRRWIMQGDLPPGQIALEVFDFLSRMVTRLLMAGCKAAGTGQALVVGGVASSGLLKNMVARRLSKTGSPIHVMFGKPEYSGDNAAGIAWLGAQRYWES